MQHRDLDTENSLVSHKKPRGQSSTALEVLAREQNCLLDGLRCVNEAGNRLVCDPMPPIDDHFRYTGSRVHLAVTNRNKK